MISVAERRRVLAGVMLLAVTVAEGKLVFYSLTRRDLSHSVQGLLLTERARLHGRQVFMQRWNLADRFVLEHIVGAHPREAPSVNGFIREARRGDYVVLADGNGNGSADDPELVAVRRTRRHRLCRRASDPISLPSR